MAPHEEEDDPAVYRSGSSKKKGEAAKNNRNEGKSGKEAEGMDVEGSEAEDEEEEAEDGTLLTVQPGFNRLLLVLRDEKVMRFVKYVSAAAEGSRWDVCAEYEIGMVAEEDDIDDSEVED